MPRTRRRPRRILIPVQFQGDRPAFREVEDDTLRGINLRGTRDQPKRTSVPSALEMKREFLLFVWRPVSGDEAPDKTRCRCIVFDDEGVGRQCSHAYATKGAGMLRGHRFCIDHKREIVAYLKWYHDTGADDECETT